VLERKRLNIPEDKPLARTAESLPHIIVQDEAFTLNQYLLRPCPRLKTQGYQGNHVFNYR
jgi:hypothetical protein